MKIGELAKKTDVSIRTLQFYDEKGLLEPSARTDSGHRTYTKDDLVRLQQILILKNIGLSLEEIGQVIEKDGSDVLELLDTNVARIEGEIAEQTEMLKLLKQAHDYLRHRDAVESHELIAVIKELSLVPQYYSDRQLKMMKERDQILRAEGKSDVLRDIPTMIPAIRDAMSRQLPPSDPEVLATMTRWCEIYESVVGDDKDLAMSAKKMLDENPDLLELYQLDEETMDYIGKAKAYL